MKEEKLERPPPSKENVVCKSKELQKRTEFLRQN